MLAVSTSCSNKNFTSECRSPGTKKKNNWAAAYVLVWKTGSCRIFPFSNAAEISSNGVCGTMPLKILVLYPRRMFSEARYGFTNKCWTVCKLQNQNSCCVVVVDHWQCASQSLVVAAICMRSLEHNSVMLATDNHSLESNPWTARSPI